MDKDMIMRLAELSRLELDESECERLAADMTDIIALMDSIKEYDPPAEAEGDALALGCLRDDEIGAPMPAEKVLANAGQHGGAFVVPKVVG